MKYLVLIAVLAVAYMLWRQKRLDRPTRGRSGPASSSTGPAPGQPAAAAKPQEMIRCSHCGLHLPREDAVTGTGGRLFCSTQHRDLPSA